MGFSSSSNMFANSTRQMQGRQLPQQAGSQQQQSQSSQQFLYQQQHLLKQKQQQQQLQGYIPSSIMQSHMQQQQPEQQQQNPMQSTQLQPTQQPHGLQPSQSTLQQAQPSVMQSSSGLQPNPQSAVAQSTANAVQQHPQSVLRQPQQPSQQSMHQQAPVLHQQQHPVLPSQQHTQQQLNAPNLQQNQLIGQQNYVSDLQQQQQQGLLNQQNNIANMQQHLLGNIIPHQQLLGQQSNMSCSSDKRPQWHGTTNVAFASRDGIVMTADRKSTSVITLVAKEKCKIFKAGCIGITVSGNVTDSQELVQVLTKMVEADQVCMFDEKVEGYVWRLYNWARQNNMRNHNCALLLAGYDLVEGKKYIPRIFLLLSSYYVDVTKIRVRDKNELEYWAGSGGVFAYQYLAGRDLANMSNPEAINVGMGAVDFAIMHDPYSGFGCNYLLIERDEIGSIEMLTIDELKDCRGSFSSLYC